MGGKKKGAGAKPKPGDEDGDGPKAMQAALEAAVDGLKAKLVLEQERKDRSLTKEKEIRDNEKELKHDLDE